MSKRKWLVTGFSIIAVILLTLASLTNVIGYKTVELSHQQTITEAINQRELLFQTICDIANNQEIQRIILINQLRQGDFPLVNVPVVTKNHLRQLYFIGWILSKFISLSTLQSIAGKYQFSNQEIEKEINAVIEKDAALNTEITQLQHFECDCERENITRWNFPILCRVLYPIFFIGITLALLSLPANRFGWIILDFISPFGFIFNCSWSPY